MGFQISDDVLRRNGVPVPAKKRAKGKPELLPNSFASGDGWVEFVVGLHVVSGDNSRGMKSKIGRAGHERIAVGRHLATRLDFLCVYAWEAQSSNHIVVTLTRLGGREMDWSGVVGAVKFVQDTTALFLGVGDGPRGPIRWEYGQEPGGPCGVKIRIERGTK